MRPAVMALDRQNSGVNARSSAIMLSLSIFEISIRGIVPTLRAGANADGGHCRRHAPSSSAPMSPQRATADDRALVGRRCYRNLWLAAESCMSTTSIGIEADQKPLVV